MKEFRSLEDVERAGLGDCAYRAVHGTLKRLIDAYAACGEEYVPEDDGHVVLLEPGDTDEPRPSSTGAFWYNHCHGEGAAERKRSRTKPGICLEPVERCPTPWRRRLSRCGARQVRLG